MFRQGLGRKEIKGKYQTLYAEYSAESGERSFVLETRKADRLDCPGENRWQCLQKEGLSTEEAMSFLSNEATLSSSGEEAVIGIPNKRPRLIIKPVCRNGWYDRVVPGWATHITTRAVTCEDGQIGIQFLAAYNNARSPEGKLVSRS